MPQDRQLDLFRSTLPSHGFATDDLKYGLRFLPYAELVARAIIQFNWRHSVKWLAYDDDNELSRFNWNDRLCPPPNILAINQANGHGHLFYGLLTPVHNYEGASAKALRYMGAVDVALTEALGADPGYTKLLAKNPLHDRWEVLFPRESLYDLDELASWVDLDQYRDKRRRLPNVGYGRNCSLFETLRIWAYRQRRKQSFLSEEMFRDSVLNHAFSINAGFEPPLSHSEVRATAKSVSRWTWRNLSPEGFIELQRKRGKRSGEARRMKAVERRKAVSETIRQCPTLSQGDIAAIHGISLRTVNGYVNILKKDVLSEKVPCVFNRGRPTK